MRVGLVLSGGGAKGAYQVGVVKALANAGVEVSMISGASIGALNGGIVSSAGSLDEAARRLDDVWGTLADEPPLQANPAGYARYLTMLSAAGVPGAGPWVVRLLVSSLAGRAIKSGVSSADGLFDELPLRKLLDAYLNPANFTSSCPLYVALYPHTGSLDSIMDFLGGETLGRFDNRESVFKLIQDLPLSERHDALIASAAIPVAFKPQQVQGRLYSDGGQGNYRRVQGNTPITPLLGKGLDVIIVSHLSNGSFWNVSDFPEENILEIRPADAIFNSLFDALGFNAENLHRWIQQGRTDTEAVLDKVFRIAGARQDLISAQRSSRDIVDNGTGSASLEATMKLLRKK